VHVNFNLPTSFIIDHISASIYSFPHFLCIFSFVLFPLIITHFYDGLYKSVKEEISVSKLDG